MARRRRGGWWTASTGGMPHWLLVTLVVPVVAVGIGASAYALAQPRHATVAASDYTPAPAPTQKPAPVALFIGDSYSAGAKASKPAKRWTTLASNRIGWTEVNQALGGTGYVSSSSTAGCGLSYCPPYPEVIGTYSGKTPDIVVVSGGRNDPADPDVFRAGVAATLDAITAKYPDATLYVTTPLWDDDPAPASIDTKISIVREEAGARGITVLDLGQPLAGHPEYIAEDGIHPNDSGHAAIAQAFRAAAGA